MAIVYNLLMQVAGILLVVFGFTLLLYLISTAYIRRTRKFGYFLNKITGIIGTPIHELSHALFCLLFGHKITKMSLYTFQDGTLGYVEHQYNKKNIYQVFGNFFIAIAPIFGGTGFILLIMRVFTPDIFRNIIRLISFMNINITSSTFFIDLCKTIINVIAAVFDFSKMNSWKYIVILIVAICVSSHMIMSSADIKGGLVGFLILVILLLITNVIVFFIGYPSVITTVILKGLIVLIPFLSIALCVDLIKVLIVIIFIIFKI